MTRASVSVAEDGRSVEFKTEDGARVRVDLPASRHDVPAEVRARAVIGAIATEADREAARDPVDEGLEETFPASDPAAISDPATLSRRKG
ncbi:hypothetical protein [uncultured Albimonas sp.]|uniref:hypothetical protein n=1 Tax=uncultured Albimonas sp. TaxID=1331701 RepID=UPI0030EF9F43